MSLEQIGLAAVLDMTDFDRNMSKYDASVEKMNKVTADAAGKVGQQFLDLGEKVNRVGLIVGTAFVTATAAAGVALGKFVSDGIGKSIDLEHQMSAIAAVMGTTKDEIAPLNDLIQKLGINPNLKVSTTEAADAVQMLARNGLEMAEILDGAAHSTVLLANATNADFGTAADIATDVMAIFNIEAKNMNKAVDGITSVVNKSKFSIDDYKLALAQSGGVAGSVGVEFDDFNATIAATSSRFDSGSDAGTSYKVFLQRLVPDTKEASNMMRDLGLYTGLTREEFRQAEEKIAKYEKQLADLDPTSKNFSKRQEELTGKINVLQSSLEAGRNAFFDAEGQMKSMADISGLLQDAFSGLSEEQKIQAASTLFGTDAMRTAFGLADTGKESFLALKSVMGDVSAEKAAAENTNDLKSALENLRDQIDGIQRAIGDKFNPVLRDLTKQLTALVQENQGKIIEFFSIIADWVADKVPKAIEFASKAFTYFKDTVIPAIASAKAAVSPFIDLLRDALGKAVEFATGHWDLFMGAIKGVAAVLAGAALASVLAGIGTALAALASPIGMIIAAAAALGAAWETNFWGIRDTTQTVLTAVAGWWKENGDKIKSTSQEVWTKVSDVWGWIVDKIETATIYIKALWETHGQNIVTIITNTMGTIWTVLSTTVNNLLDVVKFFSQVFTGDWSGAWDTAKEIVNRTTSAIGEVVGNQFDSLGRVVGIAGDSMAGKVGETFEQMQDDADTKSKQMAFLTGETFAKWKDAVVARHVEMRTGSEETIDEMIDAINADFNQMRQDVEAKSGAMSQATIDELERMRLETIQQAAGMNEGVTGEAADMAAVTGVTTKEFTDRVQQLAGEMMRGATGQTTEMRQAISAELQVLAAKSGDLSQEMKDGILAQLSDLTERYADGTTEWKDDALEKIKQMATGGNQAVQYMKDGVMLSVEQMADEIAAQTRGMQLSATENARLMRTGIEGQLAELRDHSDTMTKDQKDLVLANLDSMLEKAADGSLRWKENTVATAGEMKTGTVAAVSDMKTGVVAQVSGMSTSTQRDMGDWNSTLLRLARETGVGAVGEAETMRHAIATELTDLRDNSRDLSIQQKNNILSELSDMTVQYANGTTGWKDGTLEKVRWLKDKAAAEAQQMKDDTIRKMLDTKGESIRAAGEQGTGVQDEYIIMRGLVNAELDTMKTDNKTKGEDAGKEVSKGVKKGIDDQKPTVLESLRSMASQMWTDFKSALGIRSPSTLFYDVGMNIVHGLVNALDDGSSLVNDSLLSLSGQFSNFGASMAKRFGDSLSPMRDELKGVTDQFDTLAKSVDSSLPGQLADKKGALESQLQPLQAKKAELSAFLNTLSDGNAQTARAEREKVNQDILQINAQMFELYRRISDLPGNVWVDGVNQNAWAEQERDGLSSAYGMLAQNRNVLNARYNELSRLILGSANRAPYEAQLADVDRQIAGLKAEIDKISTIDDKISGGTSASQALLMSAMNPSAELAAMRANFEAVQKSFPDLSYEDTFGELAQQEKLYALFRKQLKVKQQLAQQEKIVADSQAANDQVKFLQEQIDFIEFLRKNGVDPAAVLGGVQLGRNADTATLTQAMTTATQKVADQLEGRLMAGRGGVSILDRMKDTVGKASGFAKTLGSMMLGQGTSDIAGVERAIAATKQTIADLNTAVDNAPWGSNQRLALDLEEDRARQRLLVLEQQRADLIAEQEKSLEQIVELQTKQSRFDFLKQQMDLIGQVISQGLDPSQLFSGVQFGLNADLGGIIEGMNRAVQAMVNKLDSTLGSGDAATQVLRAKLDDVVKAIAGREKERTSAGQTLAGAQAKLAQMIDEKNALASLPVAAQQKIVDEAARVVAEAKTAKNTSTLDLRNQIQDIDKKISDLKSEILYANPYAPGTQDLKNQLTAAEYQRSVLQGSLINREWTADQTIADTQRVLAEQTAILDRLRAEAGAVPDTPEIIAQRQVVTTIQQQITGMAQAMAALLQEQTRLQNEIASYQGSLGGAAVQQSSALGGLGFSELTGAISEIAGALRQMQAGGNTFNVAFQGSGGTNGQVLADIQFLNSLYGNP